MSDSCSDGNTTTMSTPYIDLGDGLRLNVWQHRDNRWRCLLTNVRSGSSAACWVTNPGYPKLNSILAAMHTEHAPDAMRMVLERVK